MHSTVHACILAYAIIIAIALFCIPGSAESVINKRAFPQRTCNTRQYYLHASSRYSARNGARGCGSAKSIIARVVPRTFPHGLLYIMVTALSAYYHMHAQNSWCRLKSCTMINLSFSTSYTTTPVPGGVHTNITVPPVQHWSS